MQRHVIMTRAMRQTIKDELEKVPRLTVKQIAEKYEINLNTMKTEIQRGGGVNKFDISYLENRVTTWNEVRRHRYATKTEVNEIKEKLQNLEMQIEIVFDLLNNQRKQNDDNNNKT